MSLSYKEVAEILKIIDASECEEVLLEFGDVKLSVRRGGAQAPRAAGAAPSPRTDLAPATAQAAAAPPSPPLPAAAPEASQQTDHEIRAPMIGTFYRRPSPDAEPFVEVGSKVSKGDPVCMIEVMKLFTTIEASCEGVITAVAAEDSAMVQFDQLLFTVKPD